VSTCIFMFSRHLKEHLKDQIEMDKSMTEEEMQFHYFKMHDYDNNNKLDGTEIVKAFTHHQTGTGFVEVIAVCAFIRTILIASRKILYTITWLSLLQNACPVLSRALMPLPS